MSVKLAGRRCEVCGRSNGPENGKPGRSITSYRVEVDGKVVRRWLCQPCVRGRRTAPGHKP